MGLNVALSILQNKHMSLYAHLKVLLLSTMLESKTFHSVSMANFILGVQMFLQSWN